MIMETKKMTKAQKYALALSLADVKANPILVEFFEHEIELLKNKNAGDRKPTATQVANEGIKNDILAYMADGEKRTVSEIMKAVESLAGASNQKATALVRQLADDTDPNAPMKREEIKGRAYFSMKSAEENGEG
jgi:hypothetical protein